MSEQIIDGGEIDTAWLSVVEPVRKSIRVNATPEKAFQTFTQGMDTWWPRTHHIGNSPMKRIVVEGRRDGSIYTEQEDGTLCPWASVHTWEPPNLFVMRWQVTPEWKYEPDREQCSQVAVRFTVVDDGTTLVELEHGLIEKHGTNGHTMREQVNGEGGWGTLLCIFAAKAGQAA